MQVGFAEEVWLFLDGQLILSGRNQSFSLESRLSPDGRLEPKNASISLALRAGRNEIILAVGNDTRSHEGPFESLRYGQAAEARFSQIDGLDLHCPPGGDVAFHMRQRRASGRRAAKTGALQRDQRSEGGNSAAREPLVLVASDLRRIVAPPTWRVSRSIAWPKSSSSRVEVPGSGALLQEPSQHEAMILD